MTILNPQQTEFITLISAYVQLQESRKSFKGNCPFHPDTTQSFMVNPEKQIFKCFGCGFEGNASVFADAIARKVI